MFTEVFAAEAAKQQASSQTAQSLQSSVFIGHSTEPYVFSYLKRKSKRKQELQTAST